MPLGPGKYDKECEAARAATNAAATLLIVIDGVKGGGFSMTLDLLQPTALALNVPAILRSVADDIERSFPKA